MISNEVLEHARRVRVISLAVKEARLESRIGQQHLGDQIQSVGQGLRQVHAVEIFTSHSGDVTVAAAEIAVRAIKAITAAELSIGARSLFDCLIKDDDAQRAFGRTAGRRAREKVCTRFLPRSITFLIQSEFQLQIAIVRIQDRA